MMTNEQYESLKVGSILKLTPSKLRSSYYWLDKFQGKFAIILDIKNFEHRNIRVFWLFNKKIGKYHKEEILDFILISNE